MRLKLDSNDYEDKLREIRGALNRIPKYMENPELKKNNRKCAKSGSCIGKYGRGNFSK